MTRRSAAASDAPSVRPAAVVPLPVSSRTTSPTPTVGGTNASVLDTPGVEEVTAATGGAAPAALPLDATATPQLEPVQVSEVDPELEELKRSIDKL
jgi:hypothetical protein